MHSNSIPFPVKSALSLALLHLALSAAAAPLAASRDYLSCGHIAIADDPRTFVTMYANSYDGVCNSLAENMEHITSGKEKETFDVIVNKGCACYFHVSTTCTDEIYPLAAFKQDTTTIAPNARAWSCKIIRPEDQRRFEICERQKFEEEVLAQMGNQEEGNQEAARERAAERCREAVSVEKAHG